MKSRNDILGKVTKNSQMNKIMVTIVAMFSGNIYTALWNWSLINPNDMRKAYQNEDKIQKLTMEKDEALQMHDLSEVEKNFYKQKNADFYVYVSDNKDELWFENIKNTSDFVDKMGMWFLMWTKINTVWINTTTENILYKIMNFEKESQKEWFDIDKYISDQDIENIIMMIYQHQWSDKMTVNKEISKELQEYIKKFKSIYKSYENDSLKKGEIEKYQSDLLAFMIWSDIDDVQISKIAELAKTWKINNKRLWIVFGIASLLWWSYYILSNSKKKHKAKHQSALKWFDNADMELVKLIGDTTKFNKIKNVLADYWYQTIQDGHIWSITNDIISYEKANVNQKQEIILRQTKKTWFKDFNDKIMQLLEANNVNQIHKNFVIDTLLEWIINSKLWNKEILETREDKIISFYRKYKEKIDSITNDIYINNESSDNFYRFLQVLRDEDKLTRNTIEKIINLSVSKSDKININELISGIDNINLDIMIFRSKYGYYNKKINN